MSTLADIAPIFRWLPAYRRSRLRRDVLAGAIVAALLVPQSLGYARIAGVPVEVGLYAVPLALLAYAVLGSSPQLIVGPASTVAIVSGSLVADIARDNPKDAVAITSALAIVAGLALIAIGLLRVSWLAEFLSKPIVTGFVFGLTLTIVIGELPTLLGIAKPPGDLIGVLVRTVGNVDETHVATAVVGGIALVLLIGGRRLAPHAPWGLTVLAASIVASRLFDLEAKGVAVIGDVPRGLPMPGLPTFPRDDIGSVIVGGVSLALVALAEGLAATRLFATLNGYRVQTERELIGMGAANVAAGLSGGLAVAGSLSKTAAASQAGSRSQISGITAAGIVVVVVVLLTGFFEDLPQSVLSAIIVAAVWGLMDVAALRRYARVRRADFVAATVGVAAVVLFGPLPGVGISIATSLLTIIYRSSRPRIEVLGKISKEKAAWGRVRGHPERRPVPGVMVVRLDAPLFWANATAIEERVLAELAKWDDTYALVLDLEATTQLDTTSADTIEHLHGELAALGVQLYLARVLRRVENVLQRSGFVAELGSGHIWHSISQCIRAAKKDVVTVPVRDDEVEVIADDTDTSAPDEDMPGDRRVNAMGLYLLAVRDGEPRAAMDAFTGHHLVQHGAGVRDGANGFIEFYDGFVERNPIRHVSVVHSIEDGRLVFLHVVQQLGEDRVEWVTMNFFDTDADDRVIEQWTVVAPGVTSSSTRSSVVEGSTEKSDLELTGKNKAIVRKMIKKTLMPGRNAAHADRYFADPLIGSSDEPSGMYRGVVYHEIVLLVGEGEFVATLCRVRAGDGLTCARADVFRLERGMIVERWSASEAVPDVNHRVNSGSF